MNIVTKRRINNQHYKIFLFLLCLIVFGSIPLFSSHHQTMGAMQNETLEDLWIDMRIGPPLIALFNEAARNDDIARVDHPSQAGQLNQINNGRKLVIFKSVAESEEFLPEMAGDIDIIGYNLEHGQTTPEDEKNDPVGSIQQMRDIADEYGLELAFGPDHDFALSHGVAMAPYADVFVLQIQRQQTNPQVVKEFVNPIIPRLREANPDLQISVQVRTEGDVQALQELLLELSPLLDGISILTSPDTVDTAEDLMISLRPTTMQSFRSRDSFSNVALVGVILLAVIIGYYYFRRSQEEKS